MASGLAEPRIVDNNDGSLNLGRKIVRHPRPGRRLLRSLPHRLGVLPLHDHAQQRPGDRLFSGREQRDQVLVDRTANSPGKERGSFGNRPGIDHGLLEKHRIKRLFPSGLKNRDNVLSDRRSEMVHGQRSCSVHILTPRTIDHLRGVAWD